MTKNFCDKCGEEIKNYMDVDVTLGAHGPMPAGLTEEYAGRYELCYRCHDELIKFLSPEK